MASLTSDYEKAIALLDSGDFPAALQCLRGVMEALPGNEQVVRALVRLGRAAGQAAMHLPVATDEACQLYQCSLSAYLATGQTISDAIDCGLLRAVCFNLGSHFDGRELYAESIRHYRDAWMLGPEYEDTPNNLAQALIKHGQPLEALEILKEALERHPDSAVLKHRKTQALEAAGRTA